MAFIDDEVINKIRISNDIVDVIGSYLPLTQKGKNQFCVCPFHDDHSPSMSVSSEKQIFRCFVCGETGNVITFVMKYLNVPFNEALSILGERCGIKINASKPKKESKYEEEYELYNKVNALYKNNLNSKEGSEARKYLTNRNIDKEIIDEFDIGLSLDKGLYEVLSKKYDSKKLEDLDLVINYNGNIKDAFTNRIIFPIKDHEGNVIAFSGRIYNSSSESKYRNSKETIIFKKGQVLYNYAKAKDFIRKEKEIIICEGFMDSIRLYTIDIKNSVAIMGSSITKEQLDIIKNLKVNVTLNLDQDEAGKLGTYNIGNKLEELGIHPKVILFNNAKDSDELITKYGKDSFINAYRNKIDFIDYKLEYLKQNKNLNNSEELTKYINEVIDNINKLDDPILQEIKINELSTKYGINKSTLIAKINKKEVVKIDNNIIPIKEKQRLNKYDISEIRIIYLMLNYNDAIKIYEKSLGYLIDKDMNDLANEIITYKIKNKGFDYADFIGRISSKEKLNNTLKKVMSYNHNLEFNEEEYEDYINTIKLYSVKKEIEKLQYRLKNSLDIEEKKRLLKKIENMKKEVLKW